MFKCITSLHTRHLDHNMNIVNCKSSYKQKASVDLRFISLHSFITLLFLPMTGLKQALEKVNEYNPLMKDFPLHDLLAASELDQINIALQAIFNHMKKIRNTRYPVVGDSLLPSSLLSLANHFLSHFIVISETKFHIEAVGT